jgi:formylglycine-generating enzyme required for sulfatase activity
MTVKSFTEKTSDLSASTQIRKDNNGTPCALVKVQLATAGAQFEPNVIGDVSYHINEYWVYLPAGSKHLKVMHPNFLSLDVVFDVYGVRYLESKSTYELQLSLPSGTPAKQVTTSQYLIFQVEPKDAMVTVNGEVWNNSDGVARKFVPFGAYQYSVEAKMYHTKSGRVEVNDPNNKVQVSATLEPAFGYISIPNDGSLSGAKIYIDKELAGQAPLTSKPLASGSHTVMAVKPLYQSKEQTVTVSDGQTTTFSPTMTADFSTVTFTVENNAEIWVNDERKGTGRWTGDLASGEYVVETRLANHRSVSTIKHISAAQPKQTITLDAPTPIYGSINVSTTPDMADVYIDDKLVGQTPLFLQEYLVGEHKVRVSKANYGAYQTSVVVKENQMSEVGGALSNLANVTLTTNALAAQLFVDGQSKGLLTNVSQLGYGRHDILLKADGYNDYTSSIEVTQSQCTFNFAMEAKEREMLTFTVRGVTFTMIPVKGGTFSMGATAEQSKLSDIERPVHQVTLSNYYIGETEVTQALWTAVMGENPSNFKGDNRPVEQVSWKDCQTFIRKLNALTGKNFRLPTEAEWEYAARGGSKSQGYQYSGSNNLSSVAWCSYNSGGQTHDVKTKSPNELGIYDMSGNVWEWCQDWYGKYSSNSVTNPTGAASGFLRVNRGGCWGSGGGCSALRGNATPGNRYDYLGLRLAL